jgi:hypothetical protein
MLQMAVNMVLGMVVNMTVMERDKAEKLRARNNLDSHIR